MRLRNLLIISNDFPDKADLYHGNLFVKEQAQYMGKYFEHIYIISPVAYGYKYMRGIHQENYEIGNLKIFFPKYANNPIFYFHFRKLWVNLEMKTIIKTIKQESIDFDIIHAHFTWPSGALAIELKKEFNVPVIITEHLHRLPYENANGLPQYLIDTWRSSDALIRVSKKDINDIVDAGIQKEKVIYIPNGFHSQIFKPIDSIYARKQLDIPVDKKILLNVGYLERYKGQEYLIKSMKKVVSCREDVILYIIGEGSLKNKLSHLIDKYNLNDNIKLMGGNKPRNEIPLWMNACDIFVLPSIHESFGIVQLEAMACGKPVVATYNGGSEDIIISDSLGMLSMPANPDDLAENIISSLNKKWDSNQIISFAEELSWENIVKRIFLLYKIKADNY